MPSQSQSRIVRIVPKQSQSSSGGLQKCQILFGLVLGFALAGILSQNPSQCFQNALTTTDGREFKDLLHNVQVTLRKVESRQQKRLKRMAKKRASGKVNQDGGQDDDTSYTDNVRKLSHLTKAIQKTLQEVRAKHKLDSLQYNTASDEAPVESPEVLAQRKTMGYSLQLQGLNLPINITYSTTVKEGQLNFLQIGKDSDTDKVAAIDYAQECVEKGGEHCIRPNSTRPECKMWGHFYQKLYQEKLGDMVNEEFQMLEIGFYEGNGYETYRQFLPKAEIHSMEISCLPEGPREEGKWPWGNFAAKNEKWYSHLLRENRLHCGDANDVRWLEEIWQTKMNREDAPPLRVVVDDGSHHALHMVQSVLYWFPRIAPGGFMVVEDIQPIRESNLFRTQFLPQLMSDLHYCGDVGDDVCLPTIQPLLQGIHCEMHICFFERNMAPAQPDFPLSPSSLGTNKNHFDLKSCSVLREPYGTITGPAVKYDELGYIQEVPRRR